MDYTLTPGGLTVAPGETSNTVSVAINDDTLPEPDETVVVALSNPLNAGLGAISTVTLTITDNEPPPSADACLPSVLRH